MHNIYVSIRILDVDVGIARCNDSTMTYWMFMGNIYTSASAKPTPDPLIAAIHN